MDEVYFAAFRRGAEGLAESEGDARVCRPEAVPAMPGEGRAVGTGWGRYEPVLREVVGASLLEVDGEALPRASAALELALRAFRSGQAGDAAALSPIYLRNRVALTLAEQAQLRAKNAP